MKTALQRFEEKYIETESGCWEWTAGKSPDGYGRFHFINKGKREQVASRVAYLLHIGEIPEGLEIDHLCRNRACVNPKHLEVVDHAENSRRGLIGDHQVAKTHCPQGHAYEGANVYSFNEGRYRGCRRCRQEAAERHYEKTKELKRQKRRKYYLRSGK